LKPLTQIEKRFLPSGSQNGNENPIWFWVIIVLSFAMGFLIVKDMPHRADEGFHAPQIGQFLNGEFSGTGHVASLLGYHVVMAGVMTVLGIESLASARFISLSFCLWVPVLAYWIATEFRHARAIRVALMVTFLPMVFPLMFLIYTDIWSLILILAMVLAVQKEKIGWAGILAVGAFLVRQTNILWIGYAACLAAMPYVGARLKSINWDGFLKSIWPLVLVMGGGCLFFIWNGGVSVGDHSNQSQPGNLTNIPFFMVTFGILFWPFAVDELFRRVPSWKELCSWMVCWLGSFGFAWWFRHSDHNYNSRGLDDYIHNQLLFCFQDTLWGKMLWGVGILATIVITARIGLKGNRFQIFWFFSYLSVALMPLVEFRYQVPALALFVILREPSGRHLETWNIAWLIFISLLMLGIIRVGTFFL